MSKQEIIKIFGDRKIRSVWDDEAEIWYFSIVDVVAVLTESTNPANYWKVLKNRLKKEGNETVTNCNQLKLRAADGKMRMTDVATAEQMFRVIQSIPSPKAEPFKMWMAKVAAERIDQMQDPELSIQQALADYIVGPRPSYFPSFQGTHSIVPWSHSIPGIPNIRKLGMKK